MEKTTEQRARQAEITRRAEVYGDVLQKRYNELAKVVDECRNPLEVRKAVYALSLVSDELAKIQWVLGKRDCRLLEIKCGKI